MQVGDLIIGCRELLPDLPRTLAGPGAGFLAVNIDPGPGGTLPAGTYNLVGTAVNRWGETMPTPPIQVVIPAGGGFSITNPTPAQLPPGSTGFRVYYALVGQPYTQFVALTGAIGGPPFNVIAPGLPGTPPTRSTAFYPDSDGGRFSAYTLYRWLNEALLTASSLAGGLPDMSGIPAVASQGMYYIPGNWKKLWDIWFNGFPVAWSGARDMFYRNYLTGITFLSTLQYNAERMIIELQPQPNQSGGSTTLSGIVNVGDQIINLTSTAPMVLSLGMAVIGNILGGPGAYEIISYSLISGSSFTGCTRGMGGTVESTWPAGTPINECNIRINGQRLFSNPFTVGQSASGINVPPDWQMPLIDYMLNKAKQGEQSSADYQAKLKEFSGFVKESCRGNSPVAGPRQVGGTSYPGDGYPTAGGFRVIVP